MPYSIEKLALIIECFNSKGTRITFTNKLLDIISHMFPSNHKIVRRKILFMLGSEESLKHLANSNDYNTPIINSLSEIWIESWSYVNPIFALTERGFRVKFSTNVFSFYVAICWISDPLLLSGSYMFLKLQLVLPR